MGKRKLAFDQRKVNGATAGRESINYDSGSSSTTPPCRRVGILRNRGNKGSLTTPPLNVISSVCASAGKIEMAVERGRRKQNFPLINNPEMVVVNLNRPSSDLDVTFCSPGTSDIGRDISRKTKKPQNKKNMSNFAREDIDAHDGTNHIQGRRGADIRPRKKRKGNENSLHYTEEELDALDEAGIQEPLRNEEVERIMNEFHDRCHDPISVCSVCDQFCPASKTSNLAVDELSSDIFEILLAPMNETGGILPLHEDLVHQYNVSEFFPETTRHLLSNVLLSPRGICAPEGGNLRDSRLIVCEDCLHALQEKRLPKFAIANGNWFGQLPENIRDMTFGTVSLLRPIQTFGRIVEFHGRGSTQYGSRLTGHMYSTKLDTPFVRNKLPLKPSDTPVRVIVLSPFTSDETAAKKAKIAITKADYIIEPEKISAVLEFWKRVSNPHMAPMVVDTETLEALPSGEVSADIFLAESTKPISKDDSDCNDDNDNEVGDGGSCLEQTYEESGNTILLSSTATIGSSDLTEDNPYKEVAEILGSGPSMDAQNINTFVVRSSSEFQSENDPCYLEKCYPDLFPFGRGGYSEHRKIPISRHVLLGYMLNLSSRQFQRVDFLFPNYDMIERKNMFNKAMASTRLPSRCIGENGETLNKGEVFGRISALDIDKAAEFKRQCAAAAAIGKRIPPLPKSVNGLAVDFFTQLKAVSSPMQHSQAAAMINRLNMYAALNNEGKPDVWLTFCPKDSCSFEVACYALGAEAKRKFENQAPSIEYRLSLVGKQPVAPALRFEHQLNVFFKHIVGWDIKKGRPYKRSGLFGVPKAFVRVVEEQGRLTLHVHCLLWLAGHRNIHTQIQRQIEDKKSTILAPRCEVNSKESSPLSGIDDCTKQNEFHELNDTTDSNNVAMTENADVVARLGRNISSFCVAELSLPSTENNLVGHCIKPNCTGILELKNMEAVLSRMRQRIKFQATENACLSCSICLSSFTCSDIIDALLEHGFQRCYGRPKLRAEEVDNLIWKGLPKKPANASGNSLEYDRWLLNLASIEAAVNIHDWRHRASCFKSSRKTCRYSIPYAPNSTSGVLPIYYPSSDGNQTLEVEKINILLRRRAPFLFTTEFNQSIMAVLNCNNCTRYVDDQKVGFYLGLYTTKHGTENEKVLADTMRALSAHESKSQKHMQDNSLERTPFSFGLGRLLSAARGATNGETIGGPMAAFCARGNVIFQMSHGTVPLLIDQAEASLIGEPITASFNKHGTVHATINDYRFRSGEDEIEKLSYWEFLATQEICKTLDLGNQDTNSVDELYDGNLDENSRDASKLTLSKSLSSKNGTCYEGSNNENQRKFTYSFLRGHPLQSTHGHRKRNLRVWPKCIGQRLPNVHHLEETTNLLADERIELRERYGKSVLLMFRQFRTLDDLRNTDETWWTAYLRQKHSILKNKTARNVLENMQNFYESIMQSGNKTEETRVTNTPESDTDEDVGAMNSDDETEDIVDLPIQECETETCTEDKVTNRPLDPFVQKLCAYSDNPLQLNPIMSSMPVNAQNAAEAVANLKAQKNSSSFFTSLNKEERDVNNMNQSDNSDRLRVYKSVPTRVDLAHLILKAVKNSRFQKSSANSFSVENTSQSSSSDEWFPTLQEHSKKWGLNKKQHAAFLLCGSAFLQHLYNNEGTNFSQPRERTSRIDAKIRQIFKNLLPPTGQLLLYLSGSGGTGKSRVLQALVEFSKLWKSSDSIVVTASCGGAAVLIGGSTLHSALGIAPGLNLPPPTEIMRAFWSQVGVLFIDEFSMISPSLFALLDKRLRQLKVRQDMPFGGIHIIFSGDFFQLPPVGAPTIYASPAKSLRSDTRTALFNWHGKELWKTCLTDVIELTENHRFADRKWDEALLRWRINQPTLEDIREINNRFADPTANIKLPENTIIAVPENRSREQAIRFAQEELLSRLGPISESVSWEKRGVLLVQASLTAISKDSNLKPSEQEKDNIRNLNDKRLKTVGNLYCIIGAPYTVAKNQSVINGIANGTQARLHSILLRDSAQVRIVNVGANKQVHSVYAHDVHSLIFQHTTISWASAAAFPSLPIGCFPILPLNSSIKCRIGPNKKLCTLRVRQFPCANASVMTGHKIQGQTVDSIILGDVSNHHQYGSTGWIYVILSRVRSLEGLITLSRLSEDPKKYKPRKHVICEMERLRQIEQGTLRRLQTES